MNELNPGDTRRALHAVAELVLAGPQYRESGTIRLRVTADGFATVAAPDLRVEGHELVGAAGRTTIAGATARLLGAATGSGAGAPDGLYPPGATGLGLDDVLSLNEDASALIVDAFIRGAAALHRLADTTPILWPEHFDLGVRLDGVNYGISAGDALLDEPYAYVGVDPVPADADEPQFWNAPFGAARPMRTLPRAEDVHAFFVDARTRRGRDST